MISRRFLAHRTLLTISSTLLLLSVGSVLGQQSMPGELQAQASALSLAQASMLTDDQIEFITSGAILEYMPDRQLEHELATRDADSLRSLLDDVMSLAERMGYDPERDMGAAPLNLTTKDFGMPMPTPALLRDFKREPGPFAVHRYLVPESGVPTFGGADVAIWPEESRRGQCRRGDRRRAKQHEQRPTRRQERPERNAWPEHHCRDGRAIPGEAVRNALRGRLR